MALTGGCQCGAVRYRIEGDLGEAGICHCRMCQKAVGGPFAALVTVRREELRWTRGEPAYFRSSSVATRGFCSACGTPLTYASLRPEMIDVTIGSLDTPEAAPPTTQNGVESRSSWFETLHTLPGTVTEAKYAGLVSYQHPDHD